MFPRYGIILFLSVCLLSFSCTIKKDSYIKYLFVNDCNLQIEFLCPEQYNHPVRGTMYDIAPGDSSLKSAGEAPFTVMPVLPYRHWRVISGYSSIEEMSPYDTVRVFVINGEDGSPPREVMYSNEDYFCRYDLTFKNLYDLLNDNKEIVISFPPSEAMRKVKMCPSFDTVNELYSFVGHQITNPKEPE